MGEKGCLCVLLWRQSRHYYRVITAHKHRYSWSFSTFMMLNMAPTIYGGGLDCRLYNIGDLCIVLRRRPYLCCVVCYYYGEPNTTTMNSRTG